jgi:hypothetical protein
LLGNVIARLRGRTMLVAAAALVVAMLAVWGVSVGCSSWRQHNVERRNAVLTSVVAETDDTLAYYYRTAVGRALVYGTVTTPAGECQSMDGSKGCYSAIRRTLEVYTEHERTYDCGTTKHPRTCVDRYWTWDDNGSVSTSARTMTLRGKSFPFSMLAAPYDSVDASTLGVGGGEYRYSGPGRRYRYEVAPARYAGTAWLNIGEGRVSALDSFKVGETPERVRDEARHDSPWPTIVFWIAAVLIIAGAGVPVAVLIYNDYHDGDDNGF